jgi:dihydropyrimidine dehydrogenase (NAD+) subunit PreA
MEYPGYVISSESSGCMLCSGGQCGGACPYGIQAAEVMKALRLRDEKRAMSLVPDELPCGLCIGKQCMKACLRGKVYRSIDIPSVLQAVNDIKKKDGTRDQVNKPELSLLETDFLGVRCENPYFLSSSVVASGYDMIAKAFRLGWAGIAYKTIGMISPCKEVSPRFDTIGDGVHEFAGLKNVEQISDHTLEEDLLILKRLKKDFPSKVLIISIMGRNDEEWTYLAGKAEEAGADIIECNFSCPHMSGNGLGADVGTDPQLTAEYTAAVKKGTSKPVLAKMTPNITSMEIPARAAVKAGADGISAINTVKSIVNVNLDDFSSGPSVSGRSAVGGYSGNAVKPLALRFISDMKHDAELQDIPLSGMGGIETWRDAAEFISLGCTTVQVTTAVMQYGYGIITDLIYGLASYLSDRHMKIKELEGAALDRVVHPDGLDRDSIVYPKMDNSKCTGCGRCEVSCYDGGHQAITVRQPEGIASFDPKKCVGCHLCIAVCPVGAISPGIRMMTKK